MRHFFLSLLLFTSLCHGYAQENLNKSVPFFEKTVSKYQHWLDGSDLGPAIHVHSVEVKNDTLLVVFLRFQASDPDSAKAVWLQLQADYLKKTDGDTLVDLLLDKVAWYFEVPRHQVRIYLSDNNRGPKALCWEARVMPGLEHGAFLQEKNYECGFKSQDFPVSIGPQDLNGLSRPSKADFQKKMDKKAVFQRLEPWLVERFQKQQLDSGWSHIKFLDRWNTLKFEVTDLRKTVIDTDESSWLCEVLCGCATCQPNERLEVVLKYQPLDDGTGGFELAATISAMYGSGIWKPREGGWHDLDNEPAKKALLRKYGEQLMFDIKTYLVRP